MAMNCVRDSDTVVIRIPSRWPLKWSTLVAVGSSYLHSFFQDSSRILSGFFQDSFRILSGSFRIFQDSVDGIFWHSFGDSFRDPFWDSSEMVLRFFGDSLGTLLRFF